MPAKLARKKRRPRFLLKKRSPALNLWPGKYDKPRPRERCLWLLLVVLGVLFMGFRRMTLHARIVRINFEDRVANGFFLRFGKLLLAECSGDRRMLAPRAVTRLAGSSHQIGRRGIFISGSLSVAGCVALETGRVGFVFC